MKFNKGDKVRVINLKDYDHLESEEWDYPREYLNQIGIISNVRTDEETFPYSIEFDNEFITKQINDGELEDFYWNSINLELIENYNPLYQYTTKELIDEIVRRNKIFKGD